jgi:hypothetical protein
VPVRVFASFERHLEEIELEDALNDSVEERRERMQVNSLRAVFDKACFDCLNEVIRQEILRSTSSQIKVKPLL